MVTEREKCVDQKSKIGGFVQLKRKAKNRQKKAKFCEGLIGEEAGTVYTCE